MVNEESLAILEKFDLGKAKTEFLKELNKVDFPREMNEKTKLFWKQRALVVLFCIESFLEKIRIDEDLCCELVESYFPELEKTGLPDPQDIIGNIYSFVVSTNKEINLLGNDPQENRRLDPLIRFLVNFSQKKQEKASANNFLCYINDSFNSTKPLFTEGRVLIVKENEIAVAEKKLQNFVLFQKIEILKSQLLKLSSIDYIQHLLLITLLFIEKHLKKETLQTAMFTILIGKYTESDRSYNPDDIYNLLVNSDVITQERDLSANFLKKLENKLPISLLSAKDNKVEVNMTKLVSLFINLNEELRNLSIKDKALRKYVTTLAFEEKQVNFPLTEGSTLNILTSLSETEALQGGKKRKLDGAMNTPKKEVLQQQRIQKLESIIGQFIRWFEMPQEFQTEEERQEITKLISDFKKSKEYSESAALEDTIDLSSEEQFMCENLLNI